MGKWERKGEREKGRGKGRGVEQDGEGYIGGKRQRRGVGKGIGRGRKSKGLNNPIQNPSYLLSINSMDCKGLKLIAPHLITLSFSLRYVPTSK